jgi:hypothetical protein
VSVGSVEASNLIRFPIGNLLKGAVSIICMVGELHGLACGYAYPLVQHTISCFGTNMTTVRLSRKRFP